MLKVGLRKYRSAGRRDDDDGLGGTYPDHRRVRPYHPGGRGERAGPFPRGDTADPADVSSQTRLS